MHIHTSFLHCPTFLKSNRSNFKFWLMAQMRQLLLSLHTHPDFSPSLFLSPQPSGNRGFKFQLCKSPLQQTHRCSSFPAPITALRLLTRQLCPRHPSADKRLMGHCPTVREPLPAVSPPVPLSPKPAPTRTFKTCCPRREVRATVLQRCSATKSLEKDLCFGPNSAWLAHHAAHGRWLGPDPRRSIFPRNSSGLCQM